MSCLHAYDISTGACAKCGATLVDAVYPKDVKSVTWDELKAREKQQDTELSEKQIERYSQAVDSLSREGKANLLSLVKYLTLHGGRWGRTFNLGGNDETLESILHEVNERLWNESEIEFETYT